MEPAAHRLALRAPELAEDPVGHVGMAVLLFRPSVIDLDPHERHDDALAPAAIELARQSLLFGIGLEHGDFSATPTCALDATVRERSSAAPPS
jgi:hypothetical protein